MHISHFATFFVLIGIVVIIVVNILFAYFTPSDTHLIVRKFRLLSFRFCNV